MINRMTTLAVTLAAAVLALSACSAAQPDAPMAPGDNTAPAERIAFPDGYSNAATKCSHGFRIWVIFHGKLTGNDSADATNYGAITAQPDPNCPQDRIPVAGAR